MEWIPQLTPTTELGGPTLSALAGVLDSPYYDAGFDFRKHSDCFYTCPRPA